MDSAFLEMEENVCLKLWFKVGCSLRHTQIVPKWHLDGQLAGTDFFNTRARCDAEKKFPFLPGANLGGFGLLRNGGKCGCSLRRTQTVPKWHLDDSDLGAWTCCSPAHSLIHTLCVCVCAPCR